MEDVDLSSIYNIIFIINFFKKIYFSIISKVLDYYKEKSIFLYIDRECFLVKIVLYLEVKSLIVTNYYKIGFTNLYLGKIYEFSYLNLLKLTFSSVII